MSENTQTQQTQQTQQQSQNQTAQSGEQTFDFTSFSETLDEATRTGLQKHFETETAGLKSALESERELRKRTESMMRELSAKADKGSELEAKLKELEASFEEATRYSQFLEEASKHSVIDGVAAWAIAKARNLFKSDGSVDVEELKKSSPYLFAEKRQADTHGGRGTQGDHKAAKTDMNSIIRRWAGRN